MTATSFAWFDCFAGIAGDMALAALLDAGAELEALRAGLARLPLEPYGLDVERVERGGIGATMVTVRPQGGARRRTWGELRTVVAEADLSERVRERSLATLERLAVAEGRVHRVPPEEVHFHEVGAVDTLVDVVGTALLLDQLGVTDVRASSVALGSGTVRGEHGVLPVPAPAVLELLRDAPVHAGGVAAELTTPTGAAILAASASSWGELPPVRVAAIGYGAGSRRHDEVPNLLRVVLGEPAADSAEADGALVVEANIDDLSPQVVPWVIERLLAAGAADAWVTPILMKEGRPGVTISVLCPPGREAALRAVLWRETSTLGARGYRVRKWALERDLVVVEVAGGTVRVKLGLHEGAVVNVAPEFADCARIAEATGTPLKEVLASARLAADRQLAARAD
jgi:pyridinium-3,5-bisthiocarboxylic acid mononucleotide nickel chelatase